MFNIRYTKNGGMWFLRIGRFQFSWCLCSAEKTEILFNQRFLSAYARLYER